MISADGAWIAFITNAAYEPLTEDPLFKGDDIYVTDDGSQFHRISKTIGGGVTSFSVRAPEMSANGRYVVFETNGPEFTPAGFDTNDLFDVFLVDRDPDGDGVLDAGGPPILLSRTPTGQTGDAGSAYPEISDDGRFIVFSTGASDIITSGPVAPLGGVLYDRDSDGDGIFDNSPHEITLVTIDPAGNPALSPNRPRISGDGNVVAWSNILITPSFSVFVRDLAAGITEIASLSSLGVVGRGDSPQLSFDGRFVTFNSLSPDLVPNHTGLFRNLYRRDRLTGQTTLLDADSAGIVSGNGHIGFFETPYGHSLSDDGAVVAFSTSADNLIPADVGGIIDVFRHEVCPNPAIDLGNALAGTGGLLPVYSQCGELSGSSSSVARLRDALPGGIHALFVGLSRDDLAIAGGTLVPAPDVVLKTPGFPYPGAAIFAPVGALGDYDVTVPAGLPPLTYYAQWVVIDPAAPSGFAFSNALEIQALP